VKRKPLTFEGGERYVASLAGGEAFDADVVDAATYVLMNLADEYASASAHEREIYGPATGCYPDDPLSVRTEETRVALAIAIREAISNKAQALADAYGEGVYDGMNK
jgi:hypothetical protein